MLFIFDENLPETLCRGLHTLEQGNLKSPIKVDVKYAVEIMGGKGASDEEIIAKVGELDGIIITQDKDFKDKKHYFTLYKQHNVGILIYSVKNKDVYWEKVKSFIKNWEEAKIKMNSTERPFAFMIANNGGISQFNF